MAMARWRLIAVILLEIQLFPLILTQTPSMICDSTCFGIPLGQIGCRLTPQPDLPRFRCTQWKPVEIEDNTIYSGNPTLGEVCVNLEPISEESSIFGRSSRQNSDGQEEIGDVYAKAKAICESFPYGSLFNPKAFFKKRKCTILHMDEESSVEQDHLIDDIGSVQKALAGILPSDTQYYVNAEKNESLSARSGYTVYSYENTEEESLLSKDELHHKASISNGNCLTFSSTGGLQSNALQSAGVDCESKLMPLCFRKVGASDLDFINEQCSDCDDFSVTPTCNKWESLEDSSEQGDAFQVTGGPLICTDICGPMVAEATDYCSVLDPAAYLFNYEKFVQSEEKVKKYLGASLISDEILSYGSTALFGNYGGGVLNGTDPDFLNNTKAILFVSENPEELTIGQLVARLLRKSNPEGIIAFWVGLDLGSIFCYDPCPATGDCCSIYLPIDVDRTYNIKEYVWQTWNYWNEDYTIVQNYKNLGSPNNFYGAGALVEGSNNIIFFREDNRVKHRPLCMKDGSAIQITDTRSERKNKNQKKTRKSKKKTRKSKKKTRNSKKARKGSSRRVRRQLTDTGRPIEMCATVLPALLGVCYFWPSICSDTEATTEPTTEVPDYYEDYEYDYDSYADDSDV